jgi:hypothetical protein
MSAITAIAPAPLWQRILNSERFKNWLLKATVASGFLTVPFIHQWFPDVSPQSLDGIAIETISAVVPMAIGWYRDHPDNFLARARRVINGGTASQTAIDKVAVTAAAGTSTIKAGATS